MTDSLGPWASLRVSTNNAATAEDLDKLRIASEHAKELVATKGWAFLTEWLARQQAVQVNKVAAKPTESTSDAYALRRSYESGFLAGIRHAYDTPNALIEIAKQELEWAQKASEQLAEIQGDQ